jgi:hypothetical protein
MDKLAAAAQRVAEVQAADKAAGHSWASADPELARDFLEQVGVP